MYERASLVLLHHVFHSDFVNAWGNLTYAFNVIDVFDACGRIILPNKTEPRVVCLAAAGLSVDMYCEPKYAANALAGKMPLESKANRTAARRYGERIRIQVRHIQPIGIRC